MKKRSSGIILHISSLPGKYGIGRMGSEAYRFADWLEKAGQSVWQILPLSPTGFGDSPYQSFSVCAGNPYFIDFDTLAEEKLLKKNDYCRMDWGGEGRTDYQKVFKNNAKVLKKAYRNFLKKDRSQLDGFISENPWVRSYGLFMALKDEHSGASWDRWEKELVFRQPAAIKAAEKRLAAESDFYAFCQFQFFKQWNALRKYVNSKGISIVGDIPIYVAYDSVEVWERPELFLLDKNKRPVEVAGCPPDCFAPLGQLWGNPIYNWETLRKQNFSFWVERFRSAQKLYDVIRIDHFRGFDSYYSIPFGDKTAQFGRWNKGVGMELFKAVKQQLGDLDIIAEDLGFITKSVERLLKRSGYPGMKVLEFGFDPDGKSVYLPHNFTTPECICYTGTHDNETLTGWAASLKGEQLKFAKEYLGVKSKKAMPEAMVRLAWSSIAKLAVAQMQDILGVGKEGRMNFPSTLGGNWEWRLSGGELTDQLADKLYRLTALYNRLTVERTDV